MNRYVCIHGHFYQPPRENPWLEEVELQDGAYPFHDWNERVTAECYAPNTASRILDSEKKIVDIINNYSRISFNVGPTLLAWLERHQPDVYAAILDADRLSAERFSGHGSALAQVFNHMIMPLAPRRDKYTQVVWGIKDFEQRFGRSPEGMWLPETAVDLETLDVLAELGIKFTILAPHQASHVRPIAHGGRWHSVGSASVDSTIHYLCVLPSGRTITIFFYNAPISHDVAFDRLLDDGVAFANRLLNAFRTDGDAAQLANIATDGESYGHHHKYGEMALSFCLHRVELAKDVALTNYGEFLARFPPTQMVEIQENSSWSCAHGVERWRENCGCNSGKPGYTQAWRKPLREALDTLREELADLYQQHASDFFIDPWGTRDGYIDAILDRSHSNVDPFLEAHAARELTTGEKSRALKLLEMQRNALLMYTSCGWFFDDIAGIETIQILRYAGRAIQCAEELFGVSLEESFVRKLAAAPGNAITNGADVYTQHVKPARADLLRVGAHYGISSLFADDPEQVSLYCYTGRVRNYQKLEAGKFSLALGTVEIASAITWEEKPVSFAALHLGDHNISAGAQECMEAAAFSAMQRESIEAFEKGNIIEAMDAIERNFSGTNFSLLHLFTDEQRRVLGAILKDALQNAEIHLHQIYDANFPVMAFMQSLRNLIPQPLPLVAQHVINTEIKELFENARMNRARLADLVRQSDRWILTLDKEMIRYVASRWVTTQMQKLENDTENIGLIETIAGVLEEMRTLSIFLDLWKAQNIYFRLGKDSFEEKKRQPAEGDEKARQWVDAFIRLGDCLQVRIA